MQRLSVLWRTGDRSLLVLVLLPIVLLAINDNWIFTRLGRSDPWLYYGYFLHLSDHLQAFVGTYYGTRFPWILPGHFIHSLFPPIIANYILHLIFYYVAVFSLYGLLQKTIGRRTALITSLTMGCYTFFLFAIGWNYVDGAGCTYFLVTLVVLLRAATSSKWKHWLIGASVTLVAFVYINTFLIVFVPFLLGWYALVNRWYNNKSFIVSMGILAFGFSGITLFLSILSEIFSGNLLFFITSLRWGIGYTGESSVWKDVAYAWLPYSTHLILPITICISSLVYVWHNRSQCTTMTSKPQFALLFSLMYLFLVIVMSVVQIVNYGILEFPYYASYLIPAAFLAFGVQLSPRLQALSTRQFAWLTGGVVGVLLLPFVPVVRSAVLPVLDTHMLLLYPTLALIGGVVLLLIVPRRGLALFLLFVGISLANGAISVEPPSIVPHYLDYPRFDQDVFPQKDVLVAVTVASNAVHAADTERSMLFWYDRDEAQGMVYEAVASTYLWWWRLAGDRFPTIEADKIAPGGEAYVRVAEGSRIVILSDANGPDVLAHANATLARYGLQAQVLDTTQITQGSISFTMTFVKIVERVDSSGFKPNSYMGENLHATYNFVLAFRRP